MKKLIALVVAMMLLASTTVFAASAGSLFTSTYGAQVQVGVDASNLKDLVKLSNNVMMQVFINSEKTQYAMSSKHKQAPREYATSSGDTKVYYQDLATPETAMTNLTAADSTDFDDWKSM